MSMEVDSVEDFFGPDAFEGLKSMIRQQWEVNHQRITNILAVRKVRGCGVKQGFDNTSQGWTRDE